MKNYRGKLFSRNKAEYNPKLCGYIAICLFFLFLIALSNTINYFEQTPSNLIKVEGILSRSELNLGNRARSSIKLRLQDSDLQFTFNEADKDRTKEIHWQIKTGVNTQFEYTKGNYFFDVNQRLKLWSIKQNDKYIIDPIYMTDLYQVKGRNQMSLTLMALFGVVFFLAGVGGTMKSHNFKRVCT